MGELGEPEQGELGEQGEMGETDHLFRAQDFLLVVWLQ
jgi:hypothetical protein